MMNIDEMTEKLFKPIEFTLDGAQYTVGSIGQETMEEFQESAERGSLKGQRICLAHLCSVDENTFKRTDARKVSMAVNHIMQTVMEQQQEIASKNVQGESAKAE